VTEGEAMPAAPAEPAARNLLMRVAVALVLAPAAIAIAYAGGWLWTGLVTVTAIGLYVEWLTIVGTARQTRVVASGVVALAIAGFCLASGRIEVSVLIPSGPFPGFPTSSPWKVKRLWCLRGVSAPSCALLVSCLMCRITRLSCHPGS